MVDILFNQKTFELLSVKTSWTKEERNDFNILWHFRANFLTYGNIRGDI